jgi:hypothetical protein
MRKFLCAAVVVLLGLSVVMAEEFTARITKIDGNKVTAAKVEGKGKDAKVGDPKEYTVAKDAKITKGGKKGEPGTALEGGITALSEMATKAKKGVTARVTTNDKNEITAIAILGGGTKKKQQ